MYDTFSDDYDRFVNWANRLVFEMPFLQAQLNAAAARRVLDAACGTGRHAIALAKGGFKTAGADLSAEMIQHARRNAREMGQQVPFEVVGFGGLARAFEHSPLFPFDAVLCLGSSLPHVLSAAELHAALSDFAASLRPGGTFIMQNRNFDAVMSTRARWMEPQAHREGDTERIFLRFYDYEPDGLITFNILTLKREGQGAWQQKVSASRLRPLLQAELGGALDAAGFTGVQWFGSLAGEPFNPSNSGNLVVVAQKR